MTTMTERPDVWSTPLTPLAFLGRAAEVFPANEAVVYGERRMSYTQLAQEVTRVANALKACGVNPGDRVAYLLPNIPEMLVAHFAVPLAGGVLVAVNTRLAPPEVHYILQHSGATDVQLTIEVEDGEITVVVGDNGCGFDPNTTQSEADGLGNMRRRLKRIGGGYELVTLMGKGTTATFKLPLPKVRSAGRQ